MKENAARDLMKQLFERHAVSPIPITFYPKPITKEEDVSKKLEDIGLSHMAAAVTVRTVIKGAFKTNPTIGERWFEFYGLPSDHDIRHAFKHYLEHLGVKYIRGKTYYSFEPDGSLKERKK